MRAIAGDMTKGGCILTERAPYAPRRMGNTGRRAPRGNERPAAGRQEKLTGPRHASRARGIPGSLAESCSGAAPVFNQRPAAVSATSGHCWRLAAGDRLPTTGEFPLPDECGDTIPYSALPRTAPFRVKADRVSNGDDVFACRRSLRGTNQRRLSTCPAHAVFFTDARVVLVGTFGRQTLSPSGSS